jgi:hypothetical protein
MFNILSHKRNANQNNEIPSHLNQNDNLLENKQQILARMGEKEGNRYLLLVRT